MCGIAGFAGQDERFSSDLLDRMNEAIVRRGPDDFGVFTEPGVGLAMRRLSILDLEGGHQPIENEDGSVVVVFNGEIYNYQQLKTHLSGRGHRFRTRSDTEVLVHLYEEYGVEMVHELRGMFAFAIWDRRERTLFLARDRMGIKPLYYSQTDAGILFGSEMKSILRCEGVATAIDPQALDAYLTLTYIPAPLSIYQSIRKLPAGHALVWREGSMRIHEYWDIRLDDTLSGMKTDEMCELVSEKVQDAVTSHLVSDVPVGAFLSGGVDSSLVVGLMSSVMKDPVSTFTMGFGGERTGIRDERALARLVAQRYGAKAHEFVVEPRLTNVLDDIVTAFDEPFADDSVVPSYYVCQQTSHHVKVALSGLGGDELFGGYHRYRGLHASQFYDALPSVLRKRVIDPVVQKIPEPTSGNDQIDHIKRFSRASVSSPDRRYYEYVSSLGEGDRDHLYRPQFRHTVNYAATRALITDPFNRHPHRSLVDRAIYTDLKTYLPGDILALSDRLSMWHSLELRVPLIDHELAELAMRIPSKFKTSLRDTKIVLKGVARRWVPQEILTSRKQGFESPMGAWIRTDLREYVEDTLFGESAVVRDYFDMATVRELFEQHCSGARKNSKILFSLIMFEAWHRHGRARTGR